MDTEMTGGDEAAEMRDVGARTEAASSSKRQRRTEEQAGAAGAVGGAPCGPQREGEEDLVPDLTTQQWATLETGLTRAKMQIVFSMDEPSVAVGNLYWTLRDFDREILSYCKDHGVRFEDDRLDALGTNKIVLFGRPDTKNKELWCPMKRGYIYVRGVRIRVQPSFTGRKVSNLSLCEIEYVNTNEIQPSELIKAIQTWGGTDALVVSHAVNVVGLASVDTAVDSGGLRGEVEAVNNSPLVLTAMLSSRERDPGDESGAETDISVGDDQRAAGYGFNQPRFQRAGQTHRRWDPMMLPAAPTNESRRCSILRGILQREHYSGDFIGDDVLEEETSSRSIRICTTNINKNLRAKLSEEVADWFISHEMDIMVVCDAGLGSSVMNQRTCYVGWQRSNGQPGSENRIASFLDVLMSTKLEYSAPFSIEDLQ
ncbi:hypothetical protein PF001_g23333 [Phytophthora fragariae]|uniref:Endonuclease/exonuclease/phosphatase domain-containing protein n=1 Tax=Phytophthora fragariae TaxID=53985 RepID=A0A6A4BYH8_9STRA|nr:hypothetical protein PF001_g23333 [Phytophthora fragariae]